MKLSGSGKYIIKEKRAALLDVKNFEIFRFYLQKKKKEEKINSAFGFQLSVKAFRFRDARCENVIDSRGVIVPSRQIQIAISKQHPPG